MPVDAGVRPLGELELLERDVSAVLSSSCSPCHAWSTWALTRTRSVCGDRRLLVVPGDPGASPLFGKIAGAPACGGPMPPTGRLPPASVEAIRGWIARGAPVNGVATPPLAPPPPPREQPDWTADPN